MKGMCMKRKMTAGFAAGVIAVAMVVALVGCAGVANTETNQAQEENRAYMSQVNEIVMQADEYLNNFVNAVSSDNIVGIRSNAADAQRELAKLSSLEVPSDLKDIQSQYQAGSEKLSEALNQYVQLYADIEANTIDQATVSERITQIQSLYDEGYDALKKADEAAVAL